MKVVVFDLDTVMPGAGGDQSVMQRHSLARPAATVRQAESPMPDLLRDGQSASVASGPSRATAASRSRGRTTSALRKHASRLETHRECHSLSPGRQAPGPQSRPRKTRHMLIQAIAEGMSAFGFSCDVILSNANLAGSYCQGLYFFMNASISATVRGSPGVRFSQPVSVMTTVSSTRTPRSSPGKTA